MGEKKYKTYATEFKVKKVEEYLKSGKSQRRKRPHRLFRDKNITGNVLENVSEAASYSEKSYFNPTEEKILRLLQEKPTSLVSELALATGRTNRTIVRALKSLKEKGAIRRIGSDRAGYWEIVK